MTDADTLKDMGFDPERIAWALRATKNSGLQPAMDHILANMDNPVPTSTGADEEGADSINVAAAEGDGQLEAKSIKCSECGKIFKNADLAQFHATKSGHESFEESTEEVSSAAFHLRMEAHAELREMEVRSRLAEKRATQSKVDVEEAKANELIRRKAGRDIEQAREDMKKKEAIKEAEAKKREKLEEAQARARIKAQIEADKRERAAKAAREKELRESGGSIQATAAASTTASPLAALRAGAGASGSNESRLRVRGPGFTWLGTLSADAKLRQVLESMEKDGKLAGAPAGISSVQLSNTFPRKQFTDADLDKTLSELGLVPNAGLEAKW
ncbi:hypothetical protein OC846_004140 [Tilletia horrida]|uniref:C2H2-type domain-containing protein n=1 Tax=Tilletia horrida TaxID=155126 RepID=A0AAN6JT60_9BASI|nr:hypothetical protein OC846_004140 [Tilletia horrida]